MKPIDCHCVRGWLPGLLDGSVSAADAAAARAHLRECPECSDVLAQQESIRRGLRSLGRIRVPPMLTTRLRVAGSRDRARRMRWRTIASGCKAAVADVAFWFDTLMKPMALPFAGGLMAASIVFVSFLGAYPVRLTPLGDDVPTQIYTTASFKGMVPLDYSEADVVVDLVIDESGRVLAYEIVDGSSARDPGVRRRLDHMLLYTEFTPATSFGQPVSARVRVSFRRDQSLVKG